MNQAVSKAVLITGANAGIGKDTARQLALRGDTARIYLACRNPGKAQTAQKDLETVTGRRVFETVIMDVSDLESVRAAAASISATRRGGHERRRQRGSHAEGADPRRRDLPVRLQRLGPRRAGRDPPQRRQTHRGGGLRRQRSRPGCPEAAHPPAGVRVLVS